MKLGFIYAGQGSQKKGMGLDFYEQYESVRKILDSVKLDFDLKETMFYDSENKLDQTRYTQPCMVAFAVAVTELLQEHGVLPSASLGLSLGEYSALHSAQVMDSASAIDLVAYRGLVMEQAVQGIECAMVAVLGMERETLEAICKTASDLGVVEIANYNCPGQLVIGGEQNAVKKATELALENGAKRCLPLKVSGPFHTSLMKPAGDKLGERLQQIDLKEPKIPVLYNCLGGENSENIPIATLLERQVQSSVYLEDCIRAMDKLGVEAMVEIGTGKVLSGFVRKILPDMRVYPMQCCEDFVALIDDITKEA